LELSGLPCQWEPPVTRRSSHPIVTPLSNIMDLFQGEQPKIWDQSDPPPVAGGNYCYVTL